MVRIIKQEPLIKILQSSVRKSWWPWISVVCLISLTAFSFFFMNHVRSLNSRSKAAGGDIYYVDCAAGSDSNDGISEETAWKTVSKANEALLLPGDKLLFKRGCTWDFKDEYSQLGLHTALALKANWSGNADAPIIIGAYGEGSLPVFQNAVNNNGIVYGGQVNISGSYQVIENLKVQVTKMQTNATCLTENSIGVPDGQPVNTGWYLGYSLSGDHNTVQNSEATSLAAGVFTTEGSRSNKILYNHIYGLNSFWDGDGVIKNGTSLGAIGVALHGDDSEYAYNTFDNNRVQCRVTADNTIAKYSAPFELFNANNNNVHHNKAYGHIKHFEMGRGCNKDKTKCYTADDNTLAYNLFVSDMPGARGPNIHNAAAFGPVNRTKIYNNTIVFTGPDSLGISQAGPDTVIKNNIFIVPSGDKAGFIGSTYTESNNLYYPCIQYAGLGCNKTANATNKILTAADLSNLFVNNSVPGGDFHLKAGSVAIGAGTNVGLDQDFDGVSVPSNGSYDIGAYQFYVPPTSTPTPIATATPTPIPTATPTPIVPVLYGRVILENPSTSNCAVDAGESGYYSTGINIVKVVNSANVVTNKSTNSIGVWSSGKLNPGSYSVQYNESQIPAGYMYNAKCGNNRTYTVTGTIPNVNFYLMLVPTPTPTSTPTPTPTPTSTPTPTPTSTPTPTPVPTGTGLIGYYYNAQNFQSYVGSRVDPTINFDWGKGSPTGSIGTDTFSVRWTGYVLPAYSQTYRFYTKVDDGVRLWVDNKLIIDKWSDHYNKEFSGSIALSGGVKHSVRLEFYENKGSAAVRMSWSSPSTPKQIIPQKYLFR
jgi:hypothetical protein